VRKRSRVGPKSSFCSATACQIDADRRGNWGSSVRESGATVGGRTGSFDRLLHAWFANIARVLEPGREFYLWGGFSNCGTYPPVLKANGLYFSQAVIWVKEHPVLTRKDFMGNHEWCFYGWREGAAHQFFGPNNATDVWSIKKVNPQSMVHLTEKPVELAGRALQYSSKPGENVLDLFGGSGSTLIAAEQFGRRAFLMELDPLYCDLIVQRYEQFTGKKAERIGA
jgi:DNA modification methylase